MVFHIKFRGYLDRLGIHLQHLLNTPTFLADKIQHTQLWRGSEDIGDERFYEPVHRKNFSHICTAPVKYDPTWSDNNTSKDVSFIVTGARLHVKTHQSKSVLHLHLLYTELSDTFIAQSKWVYGPSSEISQRSGIFSTLMSKSIALDHQKNPVVVVDSSVFPQGPPAPLQKHKLLKYVDTSQLCRGPSDNPGYWLVTGARLELEKGKICLQVKFSLLNVSS